MKKYILLTVILLSSLFSQAQTVADLSLINVFDGKQVTLKDFSSATGMVVIFTSVACPFDGYYTKRIKQLQNLYANKIPLLLVNPYTEAPESEEWMIKAAQANDITLPYLSDKDQTLMAQLNAQRSPEAFLLKNTNGQFSVVYRGAIDDNAQAENAVKQSYLKDAIENLLAGKVISIPTSRPAGCYIRKK